MTLEILSTHRIFGGTLRICRHDSAATGTPMRFSLFLPDGEGPFPLVVWLSGLTCTEDNFTTKAGAYGPASDLGLAILAPDTSPRGEGVANDEAYDFGQGAGFYVDATEVPWHAHYKMYSYVVDELPTLIEEHLPVSRLKSVFGHSMGGHGALTIGLRNQDRFRSVSAFSPIVAPTQCPWGEKAFGNYLGDDREEWQAYDTCALLDQGLRVPDLLVDQGEADNFLAEQLKTELLVEACERNGQKAEIRMQPGYDHSYYFISTFMAEHVAWHAERLKH